MICSVSSNQGLQVDGSNCFLVSDSEFIHGYCFKEKETPVRGYYKASENDNIATEFLKWQHH